MSTVATHTPPPPPPPRPPPPTPPTSAAADPRPPSGPAATAWLAAPRGDRNATIAQALATARPRATPLKGWDRAGSRVVGAIARRRRAGLDFARADRILALARGLASHSDAALEDRARDIRDNAVLAGAARGWRRAEDHAVDAAFALASEAVRRELGFTLHPVQILAALALKDGCAAELATGEGKTVTAVLPAMLEAWTGRGVHVVTVNDYLARRDAQTLAPVYARLGLRVGVVDESTPHEQRRAAYAADITYACDKQVIFDHLRDRLAAPLRPSAPGVLLDDLLGPAPGGDGSGDDTPAGWPERIVQRALNAAIIDEADSVLIDEAVTPAIISGPGRHGRGDHPASGDAHFAAAAAIAAECVVGVHFVADEQARRADLTDAGRALAAARADRLPAFWAGPRRREELLARALSARAFYLKDRDYIVRDGKAHIVDRSTGRILPGRQWQLGVHQAVEAKEGLELTPEHRSLARTSYQGFFQRYRSLCGMSGTLWEVRHELWEWYRLPVVRVPTHRPVIRRHEPDRVFTTQAEKLAAAADRVRAEHASGRPVLVGTWSVHSSRLVADLLSERGVECRVLNATSEADEARIVEHAGEAGSVTVATNMAGRGTDIRLTDASRALGGLLVIATERHDEPRVDRQLAGRAGRQGDPGGHACYVALDDQLIVQHLPAWCRVLVARLRGARAHRLLWWLAQRIASGRWAASRAESAKSESWMDMALHHATR